MKEQVDLMMRLVAIAAYVFIGVFPYLVSGLVAPPAGVAVLWTLWAAGWWLLVRSLKSSPKWAWSVSLLAAGVWVAVVQAGSLLYGWNA